MTRRGRKVEVCSLAVKLIFDTLSGHALFDTNLVIFGQSSSAFLIIGAHDGKAYSSSDALLFVVVLDVAVGQLRCEFCNTLRSNLSAVQVQLF